MNPFAFQAQPNNQFDNNEAAEKIKMVKNWELQ